MDDDSCVIPATPAECIQIDDESSGDEVVLTGVKVAPFESLEPLESPPQQPLELLESPTREPLEPPESPTREPLEPLEPPPLAPPLEPPQSPPQQCEPIGGSVPEDSYMPLPAAFFAALPDSLPIGLPKLSHKSRAPVDLDFLVGDLAAEPDHVTKKFQRSRIKHILKRPAGMLKRPAAALETEGQPDEQPTEEEGIPDEQPAEAESIPKLTLDHAAAFAKCLEACTDPKRAKPFPKASRLKAGVQRSIYICQVYQGSQQVCMTSAHAFGDKTLAFAAAKVLKDVWDAGHSKEDLQRCKNSGSLFGVRCGNVLAA